ncbi:MAG: L-threonylcarbamoyladenylate synthase [Actinomycetota bacterium]|nr:L-threonylcarbamoyladenylate synthase [Actinomycetota bacterium]MDP2288280.1 L-threonylcarbamoyladenylate synthase [Actinomycetota bacterium]
MLILASATGPDRVRAINAAVSAVKRGDLVLLPTESAYALVTDPFSSRGVAALRAAKGQSHDSPLSLMVPSAATVAGIAAGVTPPVNALMQAFWPGPLTLLLRPQPTLAWDLSPDLPIAVRMPLHPVILAVLVRCGPLVVTTANTPGLPAPLSVEAVMEQLGECAALAVDAGELQAADLPSTVLDMSGLDPKVVRQGSLSIVQLQQVAPGIPAEPH